MPRRRRTDLFDTVRAAAGRALDQLGREIAQRQGELDHLLAEAESWRQALSGVAGGATRGGGRRSGTTTKRIGRKPTSGKRVSWDEVLKSVPTTFSVEDVLKHPGAAARGRVQIYPALGRWAQAKRVKEVGKQQVPEGVELSMAIRP